MSATFRPLSSAKFPVTSAVLTLALVACGGASNSDTSSVSSAIGTDAGAAAAPAVDLAACLTTYVDCRRASGADVNACHEALHQCLRPKPPGDRGGAGDRRGCDGDHDGAGGPPPPPPPPPGGSAPPPPPPPGGPDADGDQDGARGPDGGGPRACFDALDTCASGTDATATCVDAAVTCLAAFPPPPPPPHHH